MANHASSRKRIRRNARQALVNSTRRNRIRTFIKRVESNIAENNIDEAETMFRTVQSEMNRGVSKGIFAKRTVDRKISRLSAQLKKAKKS